MSDQRFLDVVQNNGSTGYGERERGYQAICTSCGENHVCRRKEFGEEREGYNGTWFYVPRDIDMETFKYVAQMRSWNCCHEGEQPIDEFPDCPEAAKQFIKK